ncbi:hypothetical protein BLNAU_18457 [Blattamonas nauphoetae]|uniref:Uncharacterized protein n=1 Tax=Blattamonas nauphoetae TaxID=2049346 RepID=A0ABQ9X4B1_9EUKA|nr:hypothetical protein BLNAU_18457 [Blattamonas nauphoetae]
MDSSSPIPKIGEALGFNVKNSVGLNTDGNLWVNTPSSNLQCYCHSELNQGDCVRIIVDLDSTPRTLQFFVNGMAGDWYVSGIPSSVRIGFSVAYLRALFRIDNISRLFRPTPISDEMRRVACRQEFQSFVGFIKEGAEVDLKDALDGSALLKKIQDQAFITCSFHSLIFKLVPKPDGSGSGFAESMMLFLTSSNNVLTESTISFLCIIFFELEFITPALLSIPSSLLGSREDDPEVHKRGKQILGKLNEEGLSEECEQHFLVWDFEYQDDDCLMMGAALIAQWGGNVQFYQGQWRQANAQVLLAGSDND